MNSPFKFLDSYTKADRAIFFGRDREIEELYQKVFESKILLLFGVSGTGKSSLIDCGLANKFEESDWLPISVRRGGGMVESLVKQLEQFDEAQGSGRKAQGEKSESSTQHPAPRNQQPATSNQHPAPRTSHPATRTPQQILPKQIIKTLKSVYLEHFKPIYLIFDQFEELFIFGRKEERTEFIAIVKAILESDLKCKMLFSIREEYLANITEFEQVIPEIMQNRMRVEKMSRSNAKEVISGPCKVNNIELEEGFEDELLQKLVPEGNEVELTYLQVYLDKIFKLAQGSGHKAQGGSRAESRENNSEDPRSPSRRGELAEPAAEGQQGNEEKTQQPATNTPQPATLSFTLSQLTQLGNVSDLLGSFLEDQISELDDPEAGLAILKSFVSVKGTKRQITHEEVLESCRSLGQDVDTDALKSLINTFVDLRILREKDDAGRYELRHDSLASKIYEKITLVEKELLEIRQFLETALNNHEKRGVFLSKEDLQYIAPYEDRLFMNKDTEKFVDDSKRQVERAKKRIRRIATVAVVVLILIMGGFTAWALRERNISEKRELQARENEKKFKASYYNSLSKEVVDSDPTAALRLAEYAWSIDSSENIRQNLYKIYSENAFYKILLKQEYHVTSMAISPDGRYILTGSSDRKARLWDLSGNLIQAFEGHTANVNSVAFSPDGKNILTGSYDRTARLWDLSGNQIQAFKGHGADVYSVAFSPDGKSILTGSDDKTARLWDLSGNLIREFKGHKDVVLSVAFSPDGRRILTGSYDGTARLWDLSGNQIQVLKGHEANVNSVAFSPDGKNILTGSFDGTARMWDLSGNQIQGLKVHGAWVYSVAFSPDGKNILTGSYDGTACLWDLSGNLIQVFKGHAADVRSVAFFPNSKSIITGSDDRTVRLWDLSGNQIQVFKGHGANVRSVAFSPNGKSILTGSDDRTARLWDLSANLIKVFKGHKDDIISVAFSPDSKSVLTGSSDRTARLWDLSGNMVQVFNGHEGDVFSVAFSPDGKNILTGSYDNTACLWDLSGNLIHVFKGHEAAVSSVAFSPDGTHVLTGSWDETVRLWDLSGNLIQIYKGNKGIVLSVAFSPDGKCILSGSFDETAHLWGLSGNLIRIFKGHEAEVNVVAFSPDGKHILTGSTVGAVRLWDLSGNLIQVFEDTKALIYSAAFSLDGKYILAGLSDNTARLWEVKKPLNQFQSENNYEQLSITQKFDYGIFDYEKQIEFHNSDELFEAAEYSFTKAKESTIQEDVKKYIEDSEYFFSMPMKQLRENKMINVSYVTGFMDMYFYAYEGADLEERNMIEEKLVELQNILQMQELSNALVAFDFYCSKCSNNDTLAFILNFPERVIELGSELIEIYSEDTATLGELAPTANDLAFKFITNSKFDPALPIAELAVKADSTNEYIYTNLPLAYLFNNHYEKAIEIYVEWKDKPFNSDAQFETFREVFLADLDYLEAQGITHPNFEKIRALLNEEKVEPIASPSTAVGDQE